jgi:hypothetical protein
LIVKQVTLSVKAGHVTVSYVRDLRGVVDRESAAIGVLLSMEPSTRPIQEEAVNTSYYDGPREQHYPWLHFFLARRRRASRLALVR